MSEINDYINCYNCSLQVNVQLDYCPYCAMPVRKPEKKDEKTKKKKKEK